MRAGKELETGATRAKNERKLAEWCLGASYRTARQIGQDRPEKKTSRQVLGLLRDDFVGRCPERA